jgi:EAL domain-containing protein (putative c-di-GMP-specific phosphodiesterase class I)
VSSGEQRRQTRSAQHYLIEGPLARRLQTTVALAARALDFPVAMVNILDQDFRHTISLVGVGDLISSPREEAMCDAVVRGGTPVVVPDAGLDARFADLPGVTAGDVRAYVGVPLTGREGLVVGSICVMDPRGRQVEEAQVQRLVQFGTVVEDQLDLMRRLHDMRSAGASATAQLETAIRTGQIVPWYQPIIDLRTGATTAFEALARWQHPSGRLEDPGVFVPLAEDSDLIIDLDLAVMRQAMVDFNRWQEQYPQARMSINLSARHFQHTETLSDIHATAVQAGVPPDRIDLELTETSRLISHAAAGTGVARLREQGFAMWLDDFGTGWSSLEYLMQLPVNGIKIDRVVTVALGTRIGNAVTRAVTGLAGELELSTTMEGVATVEHADAARRLGCDYAQGYLWSKPMPAAQIFDTTGAGPGNGPV